ncbi:MAG TPA: D-glycerate dehydrogenase [Chthonomonadaceae bacterium]|nr:D-glycerate dehydrogenase [Chthonomonadaceae bacterium]
MKVFVTRALPEEALRRVREVADVEVWPEEMPPPRETLLQKVADVDGLLCLLTDKIDAALLDAAPGLRVVSQMAVGYDNIDVAACTARGIPVGNTPGVLTETTADLAFALLLTTARRIVEADAFTRSGKWQTWSPMLLTGQEVHHATLGIVGMGRIGYEMARRGRGFEMPILYAGSPNPAAERDFGVRRVDLDTLLSLSDFVSLHTALTPHTTHLIGADHLARMKPTGILINTARGPVVDQVALVAALQAGQIAGAGLDVYEVEPLPPDDPLLRLDNVILLPHIGSASIATRTKMAVLAAENLVAGLEGRPLPHPVNAVNH